MQTTTPIHVGILVDYPTRPGVPSDIIDAIRLVIDEAVTDGSIDRPVELIERECLGLPNGSYRSVERAYDELLQEDCLVVFGPYVSENVVPLRAHVEQVAQVPIITMAGSENALGEWCFALNNGSMPEEPVLLAAIIARDGHRRIAIAHETSLIGREYLGFAQSAYTEAGLEIVASVPIPQVESDKAEAARTLRESDADAVVHVGMGHGLWGFTDALREAGWDPPRYTTTAFEMAYISDEWMQQLVGWIGLDSFDERNETNQAFLDRFEARYGRRREYFGVPYGHDVGTVIARALAGARPLTGEGVRDAIERVKMVPAASGAPGTCLRFGRFIRQGWMGTDYLVARRTLPDGSGIVFHATASGR